jgi:hypothetical protein
MQWIKTVVSKLFTKKYITQSTQTTLGRWNVEQCNIKINRKIDLSNEDHCGPCGQYKFKSIKKN